MFDPEQLIKALFESDVKYVIIGGVAARIHGAAQSTQDFDICYERSQTNFVSLERALQPLRPRLRGKHLPSDLPFAFEAKTLQMGFNFTLTTDLGDIDLLGEIKGVGDYDACLSNSKVYELYGISCHVLSLDALIANKTAVARPRDIAALHELKALKQITEEEH